MAITTKKEALELLSELMEYFVSTGETVLASHKTGLFTIFVDPNKRDNFCREPNQYDEYPCTADDVTRCGFFEKDPKNDGHCIAHCFGDCMSKPAQDDRDGK